MPSTVHSREMMYAQIVSQPALLLEIFDDAKQRVDDVFSQFSEQRWQSVYTGGCGDSFYAGLACEMAFLRFCKLPVKALPAMQFSRYEVEYLTTPAVFFGISNSGNVARTVEAIRMARAAGADTIAITGNESSRVVDEADASLALPITAMGRSPGIRSYTTQLLMLYLCALRLGEIRQVLSSAEAEHWRQRLRGVAACMEATIQANDIAVKALVGQLGDEDDWVFVGSGPNYATALFCAAKLVESCGVHAWAQELEEWGHIQFFNRREQTPTCVLMPAGRCIDRALELLPYMKSIGRYTIAVAHHEQAFAAAEADCLFTIPQAIDEVFSPMVYRLVGELLAYHLAEYKGAHFFCADRSVPSSGRDRLRGSQTLSSLEDLQGLTEGTDA